MGDQLGRGEAMVAARRKAMNGRAKSKAHKQAMEQAEQRQIEQDREFYERQMRRAA